MEQTGIEVDALVAQGGKFGVFCDNFPDFLFPFRLQQGGSFFHSFEFFLSGGSGGKIIHIINHRGDQGQDEDDEEKFSVEETGRLEGCGKDVDDGHEPGTQDCYCRPVVAITTH